MKIAFLGAGKFARQIVLTLKQMEDVQLYAVAARDGDKAEAFAKEFGFEKWYGSYEEMLCDDAVEFVYINTTISHHAAQMEMCINAGKPVLCEKSFTSTAAECRRVLALAAQKGIFVGEALWTRYMPMAETIREITDSGRLGKIVSLHANLGYPVGHLERLNSLDLAGGALLDIGIYPLAFALICFGDDIESFQSSALMSATGVDRQSTTQLLYANGRRAYLFCTSISVTDRSGTVFGTEGCMVVENINNFRKIEIFDDKNNLVERIHAPEQISGYEYQFVSAMSAIRDGKIECADLPHTQIISTMELMDRIRHSWGMYYPEE